MIKAKCKCGHKVAVPDTYAGRRVKCAKCGGAITVPTDQEPAMAMAAAVPFDEPAPVAHHPPRAHSPRSRRHQYEMRQKAHNVNMYVALACLFAVVLGVVIIVLVNYDPNHGIVVAEPKPEPKPRPLFDDPALRTGRGTAGMTDGDTFARGDETPIKMTASSDSAAGLTTYSSESSPVHWNGKSINMIVSVVYSGESRDAGVLMDVRLRLQGDMAGLISGSDVTDEPVMALEVNGREHAHRPARVAEVMDREDEQGPERLPGWVEYDIDSTALTAFKNAASIRMKLNEVEAELSPNQVTMLKELIP